MFYNSKTDALASKAERVIEENWREKWRTREKVYRADTEKQLQKWIDKHQKDYDRPILIDWHPKDEFVAYLEPEPKKSLIVDEVAEVHFVVHTKNFTSYEFRTQEDLFLDESESECDHFRLFLYKNGEREVYSAMLEDFNVYEQCTELFNLDAIQKACKSAKNVMDASKAYQLFYGGRKAEK